MQPLHSSSLPPLLHRTSPIISSHTFTSHVPLAQIGAISAFVHQLPASPSEAPLPSPVIVSAYDADLAAISEVHALKTKWDELEAAPFPPKVALITGSTGFLGAAVAHALLTRTDMRIVLVIRASSVDLVRLTLPLFSSSSSYY